MNAITKNIFDVLFWGMFISFMGIGGYVFNALSELVTTISVM